MHCKRKYIDDRRARAKMLNITTNRENGKTRIRYYHTSTEVKVSVAQSCLTLCNSMDCSLCSWDSPGSLEWVAMPSSRGPSPQKDRTHVSCVSCIVGKYFTAESPGKTIQWSTTQQKKKKKSIKSSKLLIHAIQINLKCII